MNVRITGGTGFIGSRLALRCREEGHGVLVCETRHGFVCANAGVDLSNAPEDEVAVLLPRDPDGSARRLREALRDARPLGVVISDTFGRPWREGLVDQAIGVEKRKWFQVGFKGRPINGLLFDGDISQ